MITSVCVFCGSHYGADPRFRAEAKRIGEIAGANGLRVIYGGGRVGLMGATADAGLAAGGTVVGFIPARLLEREVAHRAITELVVTHDMFDRKNRMIGTADAFVVLPGGLGTLDELLEVVTLRQLGYHDKPVVLVNTGGYWDPWLTLVERVVEQGFAAPEVKQLFSVAASVDDAARLLGLAVGETSALRTAEAD